MGVTGVLSAAEEVEMIGEDGEATTEIEMTEVHEETMVTDLKEDNLAVIDPEDVLTAEKKDI